MKITKLKESISRILAQCFVNIKELNTITS